MAKKTITELKNYFKAGKRPTENQFGDLLDSYLHLDDPTSFPSNFKYKNLSVRFPNLESNLAVDILLGNAIQGNIEIQVVGAWNNENTVGVIKKQIIIGANANGGIWYQPLSRIIEASGPITDHIYLGDILWDSSIGQYKLTLYHTRQSGNTYAIRLTQHSNSTAVIDKAVLSDIYTNVLTGQNKHYVNYNDNVGIGTTLPETSFHVMTPKNRGHSNVVGGLFDRSEAAGGSNIVQLKYHSTADLELNSSYNGTSFRYGSYGDLNIVNNIDGGIHGAVNMVTNKQTRLSIMPNGNIGVGTILPTGKLHVSQSPSSDPIDAMTIDVGSFGTPQNANKSHYFRVRDVGGSNNVPFIIKGSGNVGIGTETPAAKMHLVSGYVFPDSEGALIVGDTSQVNLRFGCSDRYSWMQGHGTSPLHINPLGNNVILNKDGGNVGIGTQNPDQKLTVKGKIHAEDVVVDMNVPADYVFQKYFDGQSSIRPDYQMPTLQELESFVKENKHLPEIPSGEVIAKDGVNLGDFQMKLLQKIEELTLYAISQNKEIEDLKAFIKR